MSDDDRMNAISKAFHLRGLATIFEADPQTRADFAELGMPADRLTEWLADKAKLCRDLADLIEQGGSVQ